MGYTIAQLISLPEGQLDELFRCASVGEIPNGDAKGTAIIAPGTRYTEEIAAVINIFAWQGKTFDAAHGTLTNRISAFGVHAIVAQLYKAPSLFDAKECIVLDYSKTSLLAKHVRDEIRPRFVSGAGVLEWAANDPFCARLQRSPDVSLPADVDRPSGRDHEPC